MRYFQNFDRFYFILVFPVLRLTWPILQYRFRFSVVVPFMLIWFAYAALGGVRVRLNANTVLRQGRLLWCVLMMLVVYFSLPLINPSKYNAQMLGVIDRVVQAAFMCSIVHFSLTRGRVKELKFIVGLVCFSFLWLGFIAFFQGANYAEYGGAARLVTSMGQESRSNAIDVQDAAIDAAMSGMGTAASAYISAFVIPLFFYCFSKVKGRLLKALSVVLIYASYLNIKYSGINTPYMIAIVGLGLALLARYCRWRCALVTIGVFLAIFMTAFSYNQKILSFMAPPLRMLADATESLPSLQSRCSSMADAVSGDKDSYASMRYQLQVLSIDVFLSENWLLGAITEKKLRMGGHSEFLDCLAKFGLIGAFFLCMFWFFYLKYNRRLAVDCFGQEWLRMAYIYAGAWIFSSIPNPAQLGAPIMMLIIPGLGCFFKEFENRWGIR